jgi:hypothetical protein
MFEMQIINGWFLAAGFCSFVVCVIHLSVGRRFIVPPLLSSKDVHEVSKFTHYYCWHLVTMAILMMAGTLIYAGGIAPSTELAVVGALLSLGYTLWGMILPKLKSMPYKLMPQGWLFLPGTILAMVGLS